MILKKRAAEYEAEIAGLIKKHEAEVAELREVIAQKDLLINNYLEQIRLAQHRRFGTSSERTEIPDQISLFNEAEVHAVVDD